LVKIIDGDDQIEVNKYWRDHEKAFDLEIHKDIDEDILKGYGNHIKSLYSKIIKILKKYCDLDENYYNIIALWILGTYFHDEFPTFPYLYFNAMRGSGKTRILKLIATLCKNGELMASMSEAVLFRTAENSSILIDEFESIGSKEKGALRELLNCAYKKGMKVKRTKKIKTFEGESYKIEEFNVYCPICLANIWGMENVLSDRCITLILEKSTNPQITRLMEIFDIDDDILDFKTEISSFNSIQCRLCRVVSPYNIYTLWNRHLYTNSTIDTNTIEYTNTLHTNNTIHTNNTNNINGIDFINKISKTEIDSRHLELFFPLFIIGEVCGVLDETIKTAENAIQLKKGEDLTENKDISLIEFIANQRETKEYVNEKDLLKEFKQFLEEDEEDAKWTNVRWLGRALKRLNLIIEKRRVAKGRQVTLNYAKAKDKLKLFKDIDVNIEKIEEIK